MNNLQYTVVCLQSCTDTHLLRIVEVFHRRVENFQPMKLSQLSSEPVIGPQNPGHKGHAAESSSSRWTEAG